MNLRAAPYLRVFMPFVFGLSLGGWLDTPVPGLGYGLLSGALLIGALAFFKFPYRYRWTFGGVFSLLLFAAGYYHIVAYNEQRQPGHFSSKTGDCHFLVGTVYDSPSRAARVKVPLRVEALGTVPDSLRPASGNLLLFLQVNAQSEALRYGDRIAIRASIRPTEPPKNPHAFDYGRYLHFQNIHYQAFVKPDSLWKVSSGNGNPVWHIAFSCREKLLALLREHFPTLDEYAVASALLVGYKEDLSDELRTAYAETGSMHALAVSGTHVGLLYAGLFFLLRRLRLRGRWGRLAENVVLLSAIWAFTFLTGATASVLRASVMFSTYLLGKAMSRDASVWNVLAASAFGLLIYNPYFLFDAGFQLSYAAVAGMVFFYPRFYRLSPIMPKWADYAWQVLLVGFAAQIGTLPLSLYYFHQFPVFFWLAGWVVVFGGAIFMGGGAALIALDFLFPALAHWLGVGLYWMLWSINQLIIGIQHLPGSVIGGIWIAGWAAAFLYITIAFLGAAMAQRKAKWLLSALGVLLFLGVCRSVRAYDRMRQVQIAVYSIPKYTLIDFFDGERVTTLKDSLSDKQVVYAAQPNRWAMGTRDRETLNLVTDTILNRQGHLLFDPPFIQFFDRKLILLDQKDLLPEKPVSPVNVDVLILAKSPRVSIADCRKCFPFKLVVFDASNSWKQTDRWKTECENAGIPYYDVRENGAWVDAN